MSKGFRCAFCVCRYMVRGIGLLSSFLFEKGGGGRCCPGVIAIAIIAAVCGC